MCVKWPSHVCTKTYLHVQVDFCLIRVTWLIHVCELTNLCVHQDLFACTSRLLPHKWHMLTSASNVRYRSFMSVNWLGHVCIIHVCVLTRSCVHQDWFVCVCWLLPHTLPDACDISQVWLVTYVKLTPVLNLRGVNFLNLRGVNLTYVTHIHVEEST